VFTASSLRLSYTRSPSPHDLVINYLPLPSLSTSTDVVLVHGNPWPLCSKTSRTANFDEQTREGWFFLSSYPNFLSDDPFPRPSGILYKTILVYPFYMMIRCAIGIPTLGWSLIQIHIDWNTPPPNSSFLPHTVSLSLMPIGPASSFTAVNIEFTPRGVDLVSPFPHRRCRSSYFQQP